jgi:hypothetical protein
MLPRPHRSLLVSDVSRSAAGRGDVLRRLSPNWVGL